MIVPYFTDEDAAGALRAMYEAATPIRAMMLPEVIDAATAAMLRGRLDEAGTAPYWVADRGRYQYNSTLRVDELWDDVTAFASSLAARPVAIVGARWLRFGHGDYALVKDDSRTRPNTHHLEVTLDLSASASNEAEVVYQDGIHTLTVPQLPHLIAVVDRPASVGRYERPPTVRSNGAEVIRLRLWLAGS